MPFSCSKSSIAAPLFLGAALVTMVGGDAFAGVVLIEGPSVNPNDPAGNFSDDINSPTVVGVLASGVSTVQGRLFTGSIPGSTRFDTDVLSVTIPTGLTLQSVVFTELFELPNFPATGLSVNFRLVDSGAAFDGTVLIASGDEALASFGPTQSPLGPGTYVISLNEPTGTFLAPGNPLDYTLDFTVIPEPGSLALLSLAGLALLRRRRA